MSVPEVRLLTGAAETKRVLDHLYASATSEVLAFSRPPYADTAGEVNPQVVDAIDRGVDIRAIYEAALVEDPGAEDHRPEIPAYVKAGVDARLVDELPMKLVVFDRRVAIVALVGPESSSTAYPDNLLIDDPGFAEAQADAFDHRWAAARPFTSTERSPLS